MGIATMDTGVDTDDHSTGSGHSNMVAAVGCKEQCMCPDKSR